VEDLVEQFSSWLIGDSVVDKRTSPDACSAIGNDAIAYLDIKDASIDVNGNLVEYNRSRAKPGRATIWLLVCAESVTSVGDLPSSPSLQYDCLNSCLTKAQ
jgi:hypothetical protein